MTTTKSEREYAGHRPPEEPAEDFILKLHNDGLGKEEIAAQYAQRYHGRGTPSRADIDFVDRVLTNVEG